MKIRVMGTKAECEQAQSYYNELAKNDMVDYCTVSPLYQNRGSKNMYRVYIDVAYVPEFYTSANNSAVGQGNLISTTLGKSLENK